MSSRRRIAQAAILRTGLTDEEDIFTPGGNQEEPHENFAVPEGEVGIRYWDSAEMYAAEEAIESMRTSSRKSHKRHRVSSKRIRVARPANIPEEAAPIWEGAIRVAAEKGTLLNSKGKVNYGEVNRQYRHLLTTYHRLAAPKKKQ